MENNRINKNNIIFNLNDLEKIIVELEEPLEVIHCCYQVPISLYFENKKYEFPSESIRYNIQCFISRLEKVLKKNLFVHESIKDIGYAESEHFQNRPGVIYKKTKDGTFWVGDYNRLWSSNENMTVWLYNDVDGSIVLEITPVYSYPINDPEDEKHYVPYEEWVKHYKSYVKRIIPKDIAQQWLDKARKILNIIETNMAREKKMFVNAQDKEIYNEWCTILEEEYGITDPKGADADKVPTEFQTDEWWKKRGL